MKKTPKETYEKPCVDIIEFVIDDHIAASGNGAMDGESIWGGGN
ncbi:MAG: hypothetical protein ACNA7K_06890 [Acholeplasmataceae bacterium]